MLHELNQLIKSLTPSEIHRIEGTFGLQQEERLPKKYQNLFALLLEIRNLSLSGDELEERLVEAMSMGMGKLRQHCYYLYSHIMRLLRDERYYNDPRWVIACHVHNHELLLQRHLFELADKELTKAAKLAKDTGLPDESFKITLLKASLFFKLPEIQRKEYQQLLEEAETYIELINKSIKTTMLYYQAAKHTLSGWDDQKSRQAFIDSLGELPDEIPIGLSFPAKLQYTNLRVLISKWANDTKACVRWQELCLELFDKEPSYKDQFPAFYLWALDNYRLTCSNLGMHDQLCNIRDTLEKLDKKQFTQKPIVLIFTKLSIWFYGNQLPTVVNLDELLDEIDQLLPSIPPVRQQTLFGLIGALYLRLMKFDQAEHLWSRVEIGKKVPHRTDVQRYVLMLNLVPIYENKTYGDDFLHSNARAARQRLNDWGHVEPYENIITNAFINLANSSNSRERTQMILLQLAQDLDGERKQYEIPWHTPIDDIRYWLAHRPG